MKQAHWLDQYATNYHEWLESRSDGRHCFYRPLGTVETAFDSDGIYYEGRADVNALLELAAKHHLSRTQLRQRITLAWAVLRLSHVLLLATAVDRKPFMSGGNAAQRRFFLVNSPKGPQDAIADATRSLSFFEEPMDESGLAEFYRHAQNTGRVVNADEFLAKLFIFSTDNIAGSKTSLKFLFVKGHQITDGLTNFTWLSHFVKLLNTPLAILEDAVSSLSSQASIRSRLPLPQEDLYPRISGSTAKRRWFWLLTLVLRHVKKPMPAAFPNPLRRQTPLKEAIAMSPTYGSYLDYNVRPPLNTFTCMAKVSQPATKRLHRWCREAGTSIGAGAFVLVAMVMMSLHEDLHPDETNRRPFIGSFPINPRPFFKHHEAPNSMMLAFSDGVVLPFLPSSLDLEARFKVLVRQAHRQLALYQKRAKSGEHDSLAYMGSRGAGRVIAMNYVGAMERLRSKLPEELRDSLGNHSPQGDLTAAQNGSMATCGVSSVGRSGWRQGEFNVDGELEEGEDAFVADYRSSKQNVRARDGEFLVGVWGDDDGIAANVSYNGNAIDEEMVREWQHRMENLLVERTVTAKL
ncbi:hypothetical protein E4T48_06375 [Aureobasidium sp. EXF-10727]|nr:hypothetical protein E4T48_06375 [Aureobasidium sp. EXF-10727]KAI4725260.1 hypothetical protein E4T49_06956 [Aureobasidium sp. EXF-10728]